MADEKRTENLRKWKKGESGNPKGGRPASVFAPLRELKDKLTQVCPFDEQKRIWGEVLVEKALWMACYNGNGQGSITAVSEILDRILGKPVQQQSIDMNVNMTSTEEVQDILHSLSVLKGDDDSKPRVN